MQTLSNFSVPFFQDFKDGQLADIGIFLDCREVAANEVIVRQGDPAMHIYLIGRGALEVRHLPYDGPQMHIDRLGTGDVFGWSALLGRSNYSATVVAVEDCCLFRFTLDNLQTLCRIHHDTGVVLLENMARSVSSEPGERFEAVMRVLGRMMNCESNH